MGMKGRYTVIQASRGFVTFCCQGASVWMKGVLEAQKRKPGSILSKQREIPSRGRCRPWVRARHGRCALAQIPSDSEVLGSQTGGLLP